MKKQIFAGVISGVMAASLTACGSATTTGVSTKAATTTGAATTTAAATTGAATTTAAATESDEIKASGSSDALEILIWDKNQQEGLQKILDEFTKETGIKTDLQVKPGSAYWTAMEAAATSGSLPDVFWMHSNMAEMYMSNNILLDLTPYIEKSSKIDLSNYMSSLTKLYTYNGKNYAIPKDYDTIALWYNKTMFDEAGLSYPDETWTWDDLLTAAEKLTKDDGSQYGFAMNPTDHQAGYFNIIYSMGGSVLSEDRKKSEFDSDKTIKAMEYIGKLLKYCPDPSVMSETGTSGLLHSGTIAMSMQGSWKVAGYKDNDFMTQNCDVAVLPYDKETGVRASICNGLGWAASATTTRPDDCWKLLEWLGSKDMQKMQAELGVTMSAYNNTSDAWVNSTDKFNLKPYLQETEAKTGEAQNELVQFPYTYKTRAWLDQMCKDLVPAWSDTSQMADACKQVAEDMNTLISQENSK